MEQTGTGAYILSGWSSSNISGEKGENVRGLNDYWVVKLSTNGKIQWEKTVGGNGDDYLTSLEQTSGGGYILGGYSNSNISNEKTESSKGLNDYWVVKLSTDGKIQWDKTIGGNDYDWLFSIKEVEKNRYVLGGYSNSGISGDKTKKSRGTTDYWLVTLKYKKQYLAETIASQSVAGSLKKNDSKNNYFGVYPNPAKDILYVQTSGKETVSLMNQAGKILLVKTIQGKGVINVGALPTGLYYLRNNATGSTQKIIVVK